MLPGQRTPLRSDDMEGSINRTSHMLYSRTPMIATLLACVLLLTGCPGNEKKTQMGFKDSADAQTTASANGAKTQAAITVATMPVEVKNEHKYVRVNGSLMADEESQVASNVGGIVQQVFVERGDVVEKGQIIAKLDPTDPQNRLAEGLAGVAELEVRLGIAPGSTEFDPSQQPEVKAAKAQLDLSNANFQRDTDLYNKKVIPKADFDQSKSQNDADKQRYQVAWHQAAQLYQNFKTARVRLQALRKAVADTTITAPFAGLIAEKNVAAGEMVVNMPMGGNGKIARLVKIDPLRLAVTVPAQFVSDVKVGQRVEFGVEAFPDRTFTGKVRYVAPGLEQQSRSLTVEAVVDNPDKLLRPGLFATARLELPESRSTYYVPAAAVKKQGDISRVYVVEDGVARERVVTVGDLTSERAQVLTGLRDNDIVIADASKVSDGVKVR